MKFLTTVLFSVMVSCGTMEGDVNVSDDPKSKAEEKIPITEDKTEKSDASEEVSEEPDAIVPELEKDKVETETLENKETANVDTNDDNDPNVEVNVNVNVNVDVDTDKDNGNPETTGKLRKGMTKDEVIEVFPQPTTIESRHWDKWIYEDDPDLCTDSIFNGCKIEFKNGVLFSVERIKSEHLDITSF
jgi:hypothetical protein